MPPGNEQRQPKYSYLLLDSVQPNTKVNVYGVVKFAKQPYKSRGSGPKDADRMAKRVDPDEVFKKQLSDLDLQCLPRPDCLKPLDHNDYCMMLSIIDQSMTGQDQKLKCLLFAHSERQLPPAQVGDVIRFHRLSISKFAGDLQGQSCPGYAWVLFSGGPGGTLEPKAKSSQSITLPVEEKQKIEDLRTWASGHGLAKTYSRFKNIAAGCYFDSICQVISTCVLEEDVCLLLRVWDGTQTIYPVRQVDISTAEGQMNSDNALSSRAEGFVYDLCLFDDHVKTGKNIKPGDYIELCNLHAAVFKTPDPAPLDTVELVLHRGTSFGRGVKVVDANADLPELSKLKKDLDKILTHFESQESLNDSELVRAAENVHGSNAERDQLQQRGSHVHIDNERPSTSREDNSGRKQQNSDSSGSVQIIESVQNSEVGSSSSEISENRKETDSTSSVQIIESVQTSDSGSTSGRTRLKRKRTDDSAVESVKIVKADHSSKESHLRIHAVGSRNIVKSIESAETVKKSSTTGSSESCKKHREELDIQSAQNTGTVETDSSVERQSGSLQRCMLKTATIILNHPHVQRTSISDVLKHEVPYMFRVRARVYDYHPKPTSVDHFLQLFCSVCHCLCPMPGLDSTNNNSQTDSQLQIGSTFKGVPHYSCPRCFAQKDSLQELDSPPHLSYIYMMRLLLRDNTGWLLANIWKADAESFFRDTSPEELIQNKEQLKFIQECLQQICPDDVNLEEKPWIECCIRSYSNKEGTGFQIFDTVIA